MAPVKCVKCEVGIQANSEAYIAGYFETERLTFGAARNGKSKRCELSSMYKYFYDVLKQNSQRVQPSIKKLV